MPVSTPLDFLKSSDLELPKPGNEQGKRWDLFIAYASEDKKEVARPLYHVLEQKDISVWFDEFELKLGDSLRRKVDEGLRNSRHGFIILSPNFFAKEWSRKELELFFTLMGGVSSRRLPIWHNIDRERIEKLSPILAEEKIVKSSEGLEGMTKKIFKIVGE